MIICWHSPHRSPFSALSWDVPLPGNSKGIALERLIETADINRTVEKTEATAHLPPRLLDLAAVADTATAANNNDDNSTGDGNRAKVGRTRNHVVARRTLSNRNTNFKGGAYRKNDGSKYIWVILRKSGNFGYLASFSEPRHVTVFIFVPCCRRMSC